MPANIYIHIGLHKTGTTSIQTTMFENREQLRAHDVHYLGVCANHTNALFPLVRRRMSLFNWRRLTNANSEAEGRQRNDDTDHAIRAELANVTCSRVVISGEGLSKLRKPEVVALKEKLSPFALNFRIIVYVRDPYSYINSVFQQYVRLGWTFDELAANPPLPQYDRIETFIRVFGRENVDIRVFSEDRFVGGNLIADFLSAIGVEPALADTLKIIRANVGLSHEATLLLNEINKCHPRLPRQQVNSARSTRLTKWLSGVPGRPFRCPRVVLEAATPKFANDLRWLRETVGEPLFTAPPPMDDLSVEWSPTTMAALALVINDMALKIDHKTAEIDTDADGDAAGSMVP